MLQSLPPVIRESQNIL